MRTTYTVIGVGEDERCWTHYSEAKTAEEAELEFCERAEDGLTHIVSVLEGSAQPAPQEIHYEHKAIWTVLAYYADNEQRCGFVVNARSPQEAVTIAEIQAAEDNGRSWLPIVVAGVFAGEVNCRDLYAMEEGWANVHVARERLEALVDGSLYERLSAFKPGTLSRPSSLADAGRLQTA